jgi:hypothetical protein
MGLARVRRISGDKADGRFRISGGNGTGAADEREATFGEGRFPARAWARCGPATRLA